MLISAPKTRINIQTCHTVLMCICVDNDRKEISKTKANRCVNIGLYVVLTYIFKFFFSIIVRCVAIRKTETILFPILSYNSFVCPGESLDDSSMPQIGL